MKMWLPGVLLIVTILVWKLDAVHRVVASLQSAYLSVNQELGLNPHPDYSPDTAILSDEAQKFTAPNPQGHEDRLKEALYPGLSSD